MTKTCSTCGQEIPDSPLIALRSYLQAHAKQAHKHTAGIEKRVAEATTDSSRHTWERARRRNEVKLDRWQVWLDELDRLLKLEK